jgi:agmatinase
MKRQDFPFGGREANPVAPQKARFVLLPVPYEKTTTYRKGTAKGPAAILRASTQVELYDEETGRRLDGLGIATLPPLRVAGMPDALAKRLEPLARKHLDAGRIVGCLGGEHSISLGAIRAAAACHPGLGILQIDAHPDLRDEYEGTRFGHGCVMRRALDSPDVGKLVQAGIRAVSPEDLEAMADPRVLAFPAFAIRSRSFEEWANAAVEALPEKVYLSVDVDGLDPAIVPGTGTPEPGGLGWWETLALLRLVASRRKVVAFDVVELLPEPPSQLSDFAAARLVMKILSYLA